MLHVAGNQKFEVANKKVPAAKLALLFWTN